MTTLPSPPPLEPAGDPEIFEPASTAAAPSMQGDWHQRLGWLWGGNIFYLASAACILAGLYQILVPIYANPDQVVQTFRCLVVLHGYEVALLGVTLLILRWKNVTDDAVALTVLIAAFLVGTAAAINTLPPSMPGPMLAFGLAGALLAVAKLYALEGYIVGRFPRLVLAGLAILLAWNLFMPAVMAYALRHEIALSQTAMVNPRLHPYWFAGLGVTLVGAALLVAAAARLFPDDAERDAGLPFLRASKMRWIVTGFILVATFGHQFALNWAFGLDLQLGDLLPALAVACLLALALIRAYGIQRAGLSAMLGVLPLAATAVTMALGSFTAEPILAPGLSAYPPLVLLLTGSALLVLALRWARGWVAALAAAYLAAGLLLLGYSPTGSSRTLLALLIELLRHHHGWGLVVLSFAMLALGAAASLRRARMTR